MEENLINTTYDMIVAGGSLAGLLAAARAKAINPDLKILILEKQNALGGRMSAQSSDQPWSYGFTAISQNLYDYWDQTLKLDPESEDLASFCDEYFESVGVLVGQKATTMTLKEFFTEKGARKFGGSAAAKEWPQVVESIQNDSDAKDLTSVWKFTRRSPGSMVLDAYASALGIANVWTSQPQVIAKRIAALENPQRKGGWAAAVDRLSTPMEVLKNCRITDARYNTEDAANVWKIKTERGVYFSKVLVIAQSPWNALSWLDKKSFPTSILNIATKAKPTSAVVCSYSSAYDKSKCDIPDFLLIPAESVQVIHHQKSEIIFQSVIDYEHSLQAPEVLKSVKSLKRAVKKFQLAFPEVILDHEHMALVPVAWSQPSASMDRKYFEKLNNASFQKKNILFVGDSYGASPEGQENAVTSINSALEILQDL